MTALPGNGLRQTPRQRAYAAAVLACAATLVAMTFAVAVALGFVVSLPGAIGIFVAATISSVAGFAFSALCAPLLALLEMDPLRMVQTMAVCSIAIQGWGVWVLRRELDIAALAPLLAGGICALPVGVTILRLLPSGDVSPVGALIMSYGLWAIYRPPIRLRRRPGRLTNVVVGATGGITGGIAAFPGAVVAVWCGVLDWPKERQRAVTQAYILIMQISLLGVIAAMVPRAGQNLVMDLALIAYVPPALLGAACGLRLFRGLTDRQFGRAVNVLLVFAGLGMLMR